ncbi:hypothetical protein NSS94_15560 [Paenibacillus sp. FSL L8-0644]|uniref:hypothetical protein n=1 Tax=Paenibacillus sp. FSL L8-0644 TaxID=2954523 RepID=UPI0030F9F4B5
MQRPNTIRSRKTFSHWEPDTVISSRGKSKLESTHRGGKNTFLPSDYMTIARHYR